MEYKNLMKKIYESGKNAWKKFWDDDGLVGLAGIVLLALASQGPLYKQRENKFIEYKRLESLPIVQQVQEDEYLKDFIEYINSLPKEQKEYLIEYCKSR